MSAAPAGLAARARAVGAEIAARHADDVDRNSRFPEEAFAALREQGLLGVMVPADLGGAGASLFEVAAACHALARGCSATGMIYAMHQIQVACLVNHGKAGWQRDLMSRIAAEQLLLGSATTEAETGGDIRNSVCAVRAEGDRFTLAKNASVISYGDQSDVILVTARRNPDAPSSDQVLVVVTRDDYRLEKTTRWDALGMRGTCSDGYRLEAAGVAGQILPLPYADLSAQTMLPVTHILWSSTWLGIAADAVSRARAFVRAEAKRKPGTTPSSALRLAEATAKLQQMKATILTAIRQYELACGSPELLTGLSFATAMGTLKVTSSELAREIVEAAMRTTGLAGYRNDTPYSMGRHLRDAHSAALMIGNDRIMSHTATQLLVQRDGSGPFE
ncbi:acyl-CoA dehydrogenase family protein [Azospirillum picis]|uniref:Acyl-CoA dehydrogenase n=1 Tax=Azospirillum picis TaxID=488438 RepID=A0ABU0MJM9_9PROT|nr:acyl-CoA dehydrogenase family protein [Azospirillum picis]MBP2299870.1 acyl-CoA dehydrogenase [Azospirillum picis]MDQ0533666.1 acyl-CoA dehydrogenase [Azospirillum picis]